MLRVGECRGLTTIEMSESKVKKSFTCQGPFPPLTPTPLCWKSILHSLWWVRREYFDYGSADVIQESRGSPTASEEETFDWDRSTLQPSGEPDISRTQKTNFLFRGNTLSVWEKKREREPERVKTCSPLAECPRSGKLLSFQKRWKHQNALWFNCRSKLLCVRREHSVWTQQSCLHQVTFWLSFRRALCSHGS